MKLHGNAALSWSGRRRLAERRRGLDAEDGVKGVKTAFIQAAAL
jgi:hypothetical protein